MIAKKEKKSRRFRNTVLIVGGLTAVGVGTYFGVRHTGDRVAKILEEASKTLHDVNTNVFSLNHQISMIDANITNEMDYREKCYNAVAAAMHEGVDFKYFENLGVVFKTAADREKIGALLQKSEIRDNWI